jgi:hypothetical protein
MVEEKKSDITQPTEYTAQQKAGEEGSKLYFEMYKHLTTLSTGSILLLVTFLEKIFANPKWKILIVAALSFFLLSILASLMLMALHANFVSNLEVDDAGKKIESKSVNLCLGCFLGGVICLVIFAIRNLYW